MSELTEMWKEERKAYKVRRDKRLSFRSAEINSLSMAGYLVEQKTEHQFRINNTLDLYPVNNRYHNIRTGQRGTYKNLRPFLASVFKNLSNNSRSQA